MIKTSGAMSDTSARVYEFRGAPQIAVRAQFLDIIRPYSGRSLFLDSQEILEFPTTSFE